MKKIIQFILIVFITTNGFGQITDSFNSAISDYNMSSKKEYSVIETINTSDHTQQVGAPQLPIYKRSYVLPAGSIVTNVSAGNVGKTTMGSSYILYPSQPPCTLDGKPCPDFVQPDQTIYNSSSPFPQETVTIANDVTSFGYHVVTVNICPFEYLPKDRKLSIFNQVNITIQYTLGEINYQVRISERRNQLTKDFIKSTVQNPSLIINSSKTANLVVNNIVETNKLNIPWKPSAYGDVPDYIIITNQTLKPSFESFVNYKIQRGIPTVLVTVEQIYQNYPGCDNPEKIRNYLKSAYQYWGAGLFVLLGGDTDVVPSRIASYTPYWDGSKYTDLYYCDVYKVGDPNYNWNSSGDSNFGVDYSGIGNGYDSCELGADNFIGRAPVDTVDEVNNFTNKIMKYEKLQDVNDTNYVNNMLFLGAYSGYTPMLVSPNYNYPDGQLWHYQLANKPFLTNPTLKKWLLFDEFQGTPFSNDPSNSWSYYQGNEELNRINTLDRMSNGYSGIGKFHLISHFDHGGPWGVGVSSRMKSNGIYREDMDILSNGSYYQIMYSTACEDGEFQKDCFAEHYVNATNGGGVAMIANSGTVATGANEQDNKLFNSIYGNLSPTSYIMGVAFANTRDAVNEVYRKKRLTLFGEPTMSTWSATPQNIVLTVPSTLTIDNTIANNLPVTINALTNDATVTLYKYNTVTNQIEIYASQIILAGATTAQFTLNPDTAGIMIVKVTAKNYLPATANVNILLPQAHLYVTGYSFTDSNGNGIIEQGETINLTINLTNSGGASITNINTVLSINPTFANVTNSTVTYAQINAGQTVSLTGYSFVAQVANGTVVFPDFIELLLNITAAGNYTHLDNFYLDLKSPKLNLGVRTVTNGTTVITSFPNNQNLNLSIAIKNIGNSVTGALTATLTSSNSNIQIISPTSSYANLNVFAEGNNATAFIFKLPIGFSGAIPLTLTLTNSFGKTWSFSFNLNEALPPLITNFHFTSSKDEIRLMWDPISNIQGYNIYRSSEINGTYEKKNTFLVSGTSAYNDTQLPLMSVFYYKISVVTISGNERTLVQVVTNDNPAKQGYIAWTSLDNHTAFPIYPLSSSANVISSTTLYDVDNNGTKEIFYNSINGAANLGQTFGFYESGQEMFDIDGNVTTVSGFNNTNIGFWANSAVGDIDNDGHGEVLSIGRNNDTNEGKLFALRTTDANGDNKPDKFWNDEIIDFQWRTIRNPVLYDIDGNDFLDIIVVDEHQKIWVYDKDKNLLPGWPQQIIDGNVTFDYSLGNVAVADIDHDGKGEIAIGLKSLNNQGNGGIYIFNHDGTPFTVNPFKTFDVGEISDSGIVFADIDNDYNLDLLITAQQENTNVPSRIYAFKLDGTPVNSNWNGANTFVTSTNYHATPGIAVGDLNHDGSLEVVYGSKDKLYVLNSDGSVRVGFPKTINDINASAPALADIDGDDEVEIVINNGGILSAYNPDGSSCIGFPISSPAGAFSASPSIDDIDSNGLNEIVIATQNGTICAYNSFGHSDKIEWGSYRGNPHNTGTYKEVCNMDLDLMVKDGFDDAGIEPNITTQYMWTSDNIWIRNNNDTSLEHQNPEYSANGNPVFVKVKVVNNSCVASTGAEQLTLNWAKASTGLSYPSPWYGGVYYNGTNISMGGLVGTLNIPVLQPGHEVILTFPWIAPNPADYGNIDQWHFCLLAKIQAPNDPMTFPETNDLVANVRNNNNIAWKNITIIDATPSGTSSPGGSVAVGNPFDHPRTFFLEMEVADLETGKPIFQEAEVGVKMDETLYNAWVRGGKDAQMLDPTLEEKRKVVKGDHVILDNLAFAANETGVLRLNFNFLTKELTEKTNYVYHVVQKDSDTGEIIGGETYVINKKPRIPFEADAGGDKEVDINQPITISANDINEPAIYNWYDNSGNLIFQGKDLQIAKAVAEKYKLEVISTLDGFKDYTQVEVKLKPNRLESISPNPARENLNIRYKLNKANSAYLIINSYYINNSISNNYLIDINSNETNIDLINYPSGFYKVALIADGAVVDVKIVYKL